MNCTDFLSQLTDYFEGQVPPDLLEEVRIHLSECSHCTVVLNTTRQTIEVYRGNEIYDISDDLRERLHSAIMSKCLASKR